MNLSDGIRPRAFQLLIADGPTPAITAAAADPPRASITESTVVSIPIEYSHDVNLSSGHKKAIFTGCEVGPNRLVSRAQHDIAYRLELTRQAIGVSPAQLCKAVGMGSNQWSQYVDPKGDRRITIDVVYRLKDEYGVTFDWVYDGDRSTLPDRLSDKIRAAERDGLVDLSRMRGRRTTIKSRKINSQEVK